MPADQGHKPLAFSGMQPTGNLHLGNYLGALRNWVKLQEQQACIYCVVDLHAITTFQDPKELKDAIRACAAAYIASGIDPKSHIVFNQSQVPQHAELAWVFNCVARMGWLNRMTQFKEKAGKNRENASAGLFVYPNLMAADVLVYKATHVPVGEDQKQHLELMRDIAQKFNSDFGVPDFFPQPEPVITGPATRVMSLRDGSAKMSKSDTSDNSRINLTDDTDTIVRKIRKAKTDPHSLPDQIQGLADRPEAENLLSIFAAMSDQTLEQVVTQFAGATFSDFKSELSDLAVSTLAPVTEEMARLVAAPDHIDQILGEGAQRARELADTTLKEVYDIVGFVRSA